MSIRAVLLFLLIMVAIAIAGGPGFRRFMAKVLGISRRDR